MMDSVVIFFHTIFSHRLSTMCIVGNSSVEIIVSIHEECFDEKHKSKRIFQKNFKGASRRKIYE
ncbi:uncharacterized protein LOC122535223 isoform X2 [Frieseomelitta varia]|uniref:uncharacterized protein LOC122535223 isoform X2 n=1 Tax=Frieseomelitta varia TaxID=561572 RepID=UPI001CB69580|nr:uncharacterized protein LOC122535223 isoform X2 [Frieseomelitta varia]